jgi:hypothetical protein
MKRLWDVLVLTLALNFRAVAGLAGWLRMSGRIDRSRVAQIKEMLFPPPAPQAPTTQPASIDPTTQPTLALETLLSQHTNMTAGQQLDFVRKTFDERQAELERKEQTLDNQQSMIRLAQDKLQTDRQIFEAQRRAFADEQERTRKLASDQGFQDALELYSNLPPKQSKTMLLAQTDDTARTFLQAMDKGVASKIIKECKTPEEMDRIRQIMEKIRQAEPATQPTME